MLFDTDVLIWYLRGNIQAAELLDQTTTRQTSVISYMELLQGCRGMEQQRRIRDFLSAFDFTVVALSENIGHRAAIYMEQHGGRRGTTNNIGFVFLDRDPALEFTPCAPGWP